MIISDDNPANVSTSWAAAHLETDKLFIFFHFLYVFLSVWLSPISYTQFCMAITHFLHNSLLAIGNLCHFLSDFSITAIVSTARRNQFCFVNTFTSLCYQYHNVLSLQLQWLQFKYASFPFSYFYLYH